MIVYIAKIKVFDNYFQGSRSFIIIDNENIDNCINNTCFFKKSEQLYELNIYQAFLNFAKILFTMIN